MEDKHLTNVTPKILNTNCISQNITHATEAAENNKSDFDDEVFDYVDGDIDDNETLRCKRSALNATNDVIPVTSDQIMTTGDSTNETPTNNNICNATAVTEFAPEVCSNITRSNFRDNCGGPSIVIQVISDTATEFGALNERNIPSPVPSSPTDNSGLNINSPSTSGNSELSPSKPAGANKNSVVSPIKPSIANSSNFTVSPNQLSGGDDISVFSSPRSASIDLASNSKTLTRIPSPVYNNTNKAVSSQPVRVQSFDSNHNKEGSDAKKGTVPTRQRMSLKPPSLIHFGTKQRGSVSSSSVMKRTAAAAITTTTAGGVRSSSQGSVRSGRLQQVVSTGEQQRKPLTAAPRTSLLPPSTTRERSSTVGRGARTPSIKSNANPSFSSSNTHANINPAVAFDKSKSELGKDTATNASAAYARVSVAGGGNKIGVCSLFTSAIKPKNIHSGIGRIATATRSLSTPTTPAAGRTSSSTTKASAITGASAVVKKSNCSSQKAGTVGRLAIPSSSNLVRPSPSSTAALASSVAQYNTKHVPTIGRLGYSSSNNNNNSVATSSATADSSKVAGPAEVTTTTRRLPQALGGVRKSVLPTKTTLVENKTTSSIINGSNNNANTVAATTDISHNVTGVNDGARFKGINDTAREASNGSNKENSDPAKSLGLGNVNDNCSRGINNCNSSIKPPARRIPRASISALPLPSKLRLPSSIVRK